MALLLLGVAVVYFYNARNTDPLANTTPLVDDAFIQLRYAHNFANGYGLVWNRGEAPVEGSTSLTFVLFLALIEKAGFTPLAYLEWIGAFFAVASLALTLLLLEWVNPDHRAENMLAVVMLGLCVPMRYWSLAGLETTFAVFFLTASVLSYIAYKTGRVPAWTIGLVFAWTALTRPETLALFGITFLFELSLEFIHKTKSFKNIIWMGASFVLIFAPVFLWRWSYYGYPFPNTYYAKTGAGLIQIKGGIDYFVESMTVILSGTSLPLLLSLLTFRKMRSERVYILLLMLSSWLIVTLDGGDHFPNARFFAPSLPLLFSLTAIGISELTGHISKINRALFLAVLAIMTINAFQPSQSLVRPGISRTPKADNGSFQYLKDWNTGFAIMGKTLHKVAAPNQTIAAVPIGAIGYFSEIKVLDMLGLTDTVIAHEPFDPVFVAIWKPGHNKGDGKYVLSKRPDFIQLIDRLTSQPLPGIDGHSEAFKSIVEIWNSPEFLQLYEFHPIQVENGWYYNLYRLKR